MIIVVDIVCNNCHVNVTLFMMTSFLLLLNLILLLFILLMLTFLVSLGYFCFINSLVVLFGFVQYYCSYCSCCCWDAVGIFWFLFHVFALPISNEVLCTFVVGHCCCIQPRRSISYYSPLEIYYRLRLCLIIISFLFRVCSFIFTLICCFLLY